METVVVRKELVLRNKDIDIIEDFLNEELEDFLIAPFIITFDEFHLEVVIGVEDRTETITLVSNLYKKDDKGKLISITGTKEYVHGFYDLYKVFNISTKHLRIPEKVEIYFEFIKEGTIKNKAFYEGRKNILSSMNSLEKPNILQYVDFTNKAELFRGLYFLLEDEAFYNETVDKRLLHENESSYIESVEELSNRLEYYGYDFDYYKMNYDLYQDKMSDFVMSRILLNSDELLKYFIIVAVGMISEGKVTNLHDKIKSKIYDIFYQKLEAEGC